MIPKIIQEAMYETSIMGSLNRIKDYVYYKYKNINNSTYDPKQDISNVMSFGSRNSFGTDISIIGEYFRSLCNNQYFAVVPKSTDLKYIKDFKPSYKLLSNIDFHKYKLLRLEIVKNKGYFVESNQDISINNPDVTELNINVDNLIIPEFKMLP